MGKPKEEAFKRIRELHEQALMQYGFIIHNVFGVEYSPKSSEELPLFNCHTHGLRERFNHPELQIVLPIKNSVSNSLLHTIVDQIREGKVFQPGIKYDTIVKNLEVEFLPFKNGEEDVLRLIIPDPQGRLESPDPIYALQRTAQIHD